MAEYELWHKGKIGKKLSKLLSKLNNNIKSVKVIGNPNEIKKLKLPFLHTPSYTRHFGIKGIRHYVKEVYPELKKAPEFKALL